MDINACFDESDFDADVEFDDDPFDAAFRRREDEEGRRVDEYLDDARYRQGDVRRRR